MAEETGFQQVNQGASPKNAHKEIEPIQHARQYGQAGQWMSRRTTEPAGEPCSPLIAQLSYLRQQAIDHIQPPLLEDRCQRFRVPELGFGSNGPQPIHGFSRQRALEQFCDHGVVGKPEQGQGASGNRAIGQQRGDLADGGLHGAVVTERWGGPPTILQPTDQAIDALAANGDGGDRVDPELLAQFASINTDPLAVRLVAHVEGQR